MVEVDTIHPARVAPLSYQTYAVLRYPGLTTWQRETVCQHALAQAGAGYDWIGVVALALRVLGLGRACLNDRYRYICTELVLAAYRAAGIHLVTRCRMVTPEEMLALPGLRRIAQGPM